MNSSDMPNSEDVVINEATAHKRKAKEQTEDIRKLTETVKPCRKRGVKYEQD